MAPKHGWPLVCVVGSLLLGCMTCASWQPASDSSRATPTSRLFDRCDFGIGFADRPTVLTGFLLGGAVAEFAVVKVEADGERSLRLYGFEGSAWTSRLDATLDAAVEFVDVVELGGRDRLIAYRPGRVDWFDPESGVVRELVRVEASFEPPRANEVPHVDLTRDVNGDGRDDLVVPSADGFHVFVQTESGAFEDPVSVGSTPDLSRIYGADGYRYDPWSQSRVYGMDCDHDGRGDLVSWDADHFDVWLQGEGGELASEPMTLSTEVVIDSDDPSFFASGEMAGRVLDAIVDMNGDGVGDLVVHSLSRGPRALEHSVYEIHFGARSADGGTRFASDVGASLQTRGSLQLGLELYDFDGDGARDVVRTTIEDRFLTGGLWKRFKGAMGDDVLMQLAFHRMRDGQYSAAPDTVRTRALDGPPSHREHGWVPAEIVLRGATHEGRRNQAIWPKAFNSTVRFGDVTGDGRLDMFVADHPRFVEVFVGIPGRELFAEEPARIRLSAPNDEEYTWLTDVNRDGKQDVVMHHPFTAKDVHGGRLRAAGAEPHRVTVLMAR